MNIAVDLGSAASSDFTGVGSRAASRDFEIRLRCEGSSHDQYQGKVGIQLDGDSAGASMPGVLRLSSLPNSATRIGIQIVRREGGAERQVNFGTRMDIGTTVAGVSQMSLPLRAYYVQTQAGVVGGGVANGKATFTIQYD